MTNKRKHQLERKVRINFNNFNQIIYPKNVGIAFYDTLCQKILLVLQNLYYRGDMALSEARFMIQCVRRYYAYYKKLIDKNFEQFTQVFVNFRKIQKVKCGKVHKMFIIQTYCIYITTVLYNM